MKGESMSNQWSRLNLGSGKNSKTGYCNIDITYDADLCIDLEKNSLPMANNEVEEIIAENLLCMLDDITNTMNEAHRVLKPGGTLRILTFDAGKYPELMFQDPKHKRGLNRTAYNYFIKGTEENKNFGELYGYAPWELVSAKEEGKCLLVILTPVKE
jgi:predicted SAM-dependent methyltransferase